MTAKESKTSDFEKEEFVNTTSCCICTDVYTDPKALPCIHTFCLKCLQQTGLKTNKGPGDEMPCPICRRPFKIPPEGFHGLPKNLFIEKLIQVANVLNPSASSRVLCDVCLEENEETGKEIAKANAYCTDCKQRLCEECCRYHRKFKLNKNHKLVPISEQQGIEENVMADLEPSVCELHEQMVLNVYCVECKTVVCAVCFIDGHENHKGSHVNKFVDGFRKQIESNIEAVNVCSSQAQAIRGELMKAKEDMQQNVQKLESDVVDRKNELKIFVDAHSKALLQNLISMRQSKLKEIQMETNDIDAYLSCLQSYNSYCQRIMAKGSAGDICRAFSDLSARAVELQHQCQSLTEREIQSFQYCFTKSELDEDCDNLIGEIEEEGHSKQSNRSKRNVLEADLKKKTPSDSALIDQLKLELDNEKVFNKTHQTTIKKLMQELENEKSTMQAENNKLKQELISEQNKVKNLEKSNMHANEELEKTKIDCRNKITDLEHKREQERNAWVAEKEQLNQQLQEQHRLIGRGERRCESDPVLHQTIRTRAAEEGKKEIRGMAILEKELFVVSDLSSEVEVYDSMKFSFSRRWNLKELIRPMDTGSCKRNKCLYIFDFKGGGQSNDMLRIDPNGKLIKKWSTGDDYGWGLSVTDESNVILTVLNKNKLNEYSSDGQLIREIKLSSDIGILNPWHAVKLTNGHFLVCHDHYLGGNLHSVCVVDEDGQLKKSFGGKCGSTIGQTNCPIYLAVDGNGFVMVADRRNSRVLLLDSDLEYQREIFSKEKHGLQTPWRILLDEPNNQLFVADNKSDDRRILILPFFLHIF